MIFEENVIKCHQCGNIFDLNQNFEIFKELHQLDIELSHNISAIELLNRKNELLELIGNCQKCGSVLRTFRCNQNHECTIFEVCPECGNPANIECNSNYK